VERLMTFLTALDQDVEIVIRKKPRSRAAGRRGGLVSGSIGIQKNHSAAS
jgi:hypothetical protein